MLGFFALFAQCYNSWLWLDIATRYPGPILLPDGMKLMRITT